MMRRSLVTLLALGAVMGGALLPIAVQPPAPVRNLSTAQADTLPPSLVYGSLLSGLILEPSGEMRFDTMWAYFLPPTQANPNQYMPDGDDLHAVLRHKDGGEAAIFHFFAGTDKPPLWQLSNYTTEDKEGEQSGIIYKIKPGDYLLDWYVQGNHFMTFPFSVAALGGDDPYKPDPGYVLDGAWEDMAYLYAEGNRPDADAQFRYWLRDRRPGVSRQAMVRVEVRSGGALVAENTKDPKGTETTAETKWGRNDTTFTMPKKNGARWLVKDMLTDGKYEVTIKVDGKPYGKYPYEVKGGKFVMAGRQVRGGTDPKDVIEGGRDSFWLQRQK